MRLYLSEHLGDATPGTLVSLHVRDVDAVAATFGVEVEDLHWARQVELQDPDGNRLRVGTPTGELPTSSSNSRTVVDRQRIVDVDLTQPGQRALLRAARAVTVRCTASTGEAGHA